ncbi:MAG: hypothetical protein GY915_07290 [bacterium]|nr:hypothetical protein [bacterium]
MIGYILIFLWLLASSIVDAQGSCCGACINCFEDDELSLVNVRLLDLEDPQLNVRLLDLEDPQLPETDTDEEVIAPLLKQLQKDFFPEDKSRVECWGTNGLSIVTGGISSYILSMLFADDGAIDDFLKIINEGGARALGIPILLVHLLPEIMHARKTLRTTKHWFREEKGLRKNNSSKLRRFIKGTVWVLGAGLAFKGFRLYLNTGYQGAEDLPEAFLCMPFFLLQTLGKSVSTMRETLSKGWDKVSKGRTPGTQYHRKEIQENFSNTYRRMDRLTTDQLLEIAEAVQNMALDVRNTEQGPLLILALLHSLYHGDDQKNYQVIPGTHPFGYNLSRWVGGTFGLISGPVIWFGGQYVMAKTLGLVQGEDADNYSPDWNGWQEGSVDGFASAVGLYTAASSLLSLGSKSADIYRYFTGYDPNTRNTVLEYHETTLPKLRGSVALFNLFTTAFLSLPSAGLAGTGFYLNGMKDIDRQIPFLALAALGYGGILNKSFDGAIQEIITLSAQLNKFRGRPFSGEFSDLEGQLRDSLRKMLVTVTKYVQKLPDSKVEALWTLMELTPEELRSRISTAFEGGDFEEEIVIDSESTTSIYLIDADDEELGLKKEEPILDQVMNLFEVEDDFSNGDQWSDNGGHLPDDLQIQNSEETYSESILSDNSSEEGNQSIKNRLYRWWQNR